VYRNRFAVASQIKRRFCTILRSDRTTRRHMEELESLGHVAVVPGRGVGPLFPKVYYVTGRGVRKLRNALAKQEKAWQPSRVDRRSRDAHEGYVAARIIHEILITEFMLTVWQTIDGRSDLKLLTVQRRSLAKHAAFRLVIGRRQTRLVPDAMFLFRQREGGMRCCFLELDNGTMNRKQIKTKYARYEAWARSKHGQQYLIDLYRRHGAKEPRPAFRLLIVARSRSGNDDRRRMAELSAPVPELSPTMRHRVWLTTVADLRRSEAEAAQLEAPIWWRTKDLDNEGAGSSLFPRPRTTVGRVSQENGARAHDRGVETQRSENARTDKTSQFVDRAGLFAGSPQRDN
jgi:hypothetical protein